MADIQKLTAKAASILCKTEENEKVLHQDIHFSLFHQHFHSEFNATFYEPALCLILQGRKELIVGQRSFGFGAGEMLIVSHELPVVSQITEASEAAPYIALILRLDINIIRGLRDKISNIPKDMDQARSLEVYMASAHIVDSLFRLLNASQNPMDSIVLLPQILWEVHYRLLQAPCSSMLRNLLLPNSHASKISEAISLIRGNYNAPLQISEVAKSVGMSDASFFHHFKVITECTPLQYQKNLRLMEARRLLVSEGESVTQTAYRVGYESSSQFSREYVRKFGSPPSSDLKTRV